jgi:hypothetical protein
MLTAQNISPITLLLNPYISLLLYPIFYLLKYNLVFYIQKGHDERILTLSSKVMNTYLLEMISNN